MCAVYLCVAGDNAAVKIGKANDPKGRLSELQVGNHEALRLLRVFEGGEAEEAALHLRFAHLHKRGDWFSFSREMLVDVGLVEIEIGDTSRSNDPDRFTQRDLIRALGGPSAIARKLGLSGATNTTTHWTSRGIPSRHWPAVADLAVRSDIAISASQIGRLPVHAASAA